MEICLKTIDQRLTTFICSYRAKKPFRAADFLDLDQGNLSKSIKRLETNLGIKILHRHRGGVLPTEAGKALYKAVIEMNLLWDSAKNGAYAEQGFNEFRVGAHESIARSYFPMVFNVLGQNFSEYYPTTVFDTSLTITKKVMNRELELGIVANPIKSEDLVVRSLTKEAILLCSNANDINDTSLFINPDMLFISRLINKLSFKKVIKLEDYDVAAGICTESKLYSCIIPSGLVARYPNLKIFKEIKSKINISLITYPGSKAIKMLKSFNIK